MYYCLGSDSLCASYSSVCVRRCLFYGFNKYLCPIFLKKGQHFSIQHIGNTVKSTAVVVVVVFLCQLECGSVVESMQCAVQGPRCSTCMHRHTHTHRSVMLLLVVKWRYGELSRWQGEGRLVSRCYLSGPMAALQERGGGAGGERGRSLSSFNIKLN